MTKQQKEWIELVLFFALAAAIVAGIAALGGHDFGLGWLYALVALVTLAASGVGTAMLYGMWDEYPALWVIGYVFFIAPLCLLVAFAVLDSLVGR